MPSSPDACREIVASGGGKRFAKIENFLLPKKNFAPSTHLIGKL
jgi:hypothetical protein